MGEIVPFLRAGFNKSSRHTGIVAWTRYITGRKFAPASLIQFQAGDYAWLDAREEPRFLSWGEQVVIGTVDGIELPDEWQFNLPLSELPLNGRLEEGKVEFTIMGEPASKANSRELVSLPRLSIKTGRMEKMPALIKSEKARDYERDALLQVPPKARVRMEGPVKVTIRIFYSSNRPDLDESVILDVLQDRFAPSPVEGEERVLVQRGVYRNDRQVHEKHIYHGIDKANPRAEIVVELIPPPLFCEAVH